jgi:hypothetical protein
MSLRYASGDDIRLGDQVDYAGVRGEIELVADPELPGAQHDWYVQQFGSGVMIVEPKVFGRVFVSAPETEASLALVARKT